MFSENAFKNADACRFCWMCRHLCPISLKTGKEVNSARAKGLLVSMIRRGEQYDSSMASVMWECCLCGACSNDCATGFEPRVFIREARSIAVAEGLAPEPVMAVVDKLLNTGNIYGVEDLNASLYDEVSALPDQAPVLLYIGEVARVEAPEIAKAAMSLLKKAGVSFTVLKDETVSGGYMGDMIGFVDEVREKALALSAAINASGAETIVVLDPIDARIMLHEYPEWNCSVHAQVTTITAYLSRLVKEGALQPTRIGGSCSIHDAGALSRDLSETEPVRELVAALGIEIKEAIRNKDLSKSCGGALLRQYDPKLSALTVKGCWEDHLRTGKLLVTEAPGSYVALASDIPEEYQVKDIVMLLEQSIC